jgi:parvulin-like peptidyl-prolyl isomerase
MVQYYKENEKKFAHPERVSLRRIFLAAGTDPQERAQAKARLEEVRKQLDAGADFAELAKTYSAGPEASQGGLMGWVTKDGLVQHLSDAAFSLPEGDVSNPLETEGGVVLLKVDKKEPAGTISLDEARKQIEPELRDKFAEEKYKKWIGELRKRSRVRIFLS